MAVEYLYGIQPILQALQTRRREFFELWVHRTHASPELRQILHLAQTFRLPVLEKDKHLLSQACDSPQHQGVVLKASPFVYTEFESLLEKSRSTSSSLLLLLDQVQDPQNLGAILRTAYSAGVEGVVLPERGSALVSPAVLKTSAGAAEHLPVAIVKNLARAMEEVKETGFWTYGAEAGGHPFYFQQDLKGKVAVVMGSEGFGLRELIRKKCDFLISIPMRDAKISSLNVSVATGILLYEVVRQRKS